MSNSDQTMWSATLLEDLYDQLRNNAADAEIRAALRPVLERGMDAGFILGAVHAKLDERAALRVNQMLKVIEGRVAPQVEKKGALSGWFRRK